MQSVNNWSMPWGMTSYPTPPVLDGMTHTDCMIKQHMHEAYGPDSHLTCASANASPRVSVCVPGAACRGALAKLHPDPVPGPAGPESPPLLSSRCRLPPSGRHRCASVPLPPLPDHVPQPSLHLSDPPLLSSGRSLNPECLQYSQVVPWG